MHKILLVDDDREFRQEFRDFLDAYEVIEKTRPNLILLDLKMPGKSGLQLASELKEMAEYSHIPIVVMSAFMKDSYAELLSACGIKKWFKKPFNIDAAVKEITGIVNTVPAYQCT